MVHGGITQQEGLSSGEVVLSTERYSDALRSGIVIPSGLEAKGWVFTSVSCTNDNSRDMDRVERNLRSNARSKGGSQVYGLVIISSSEFDCTRQPTRVAPTIIAYGDCYGPRAQTDQRKDIKNIIKEGPVSFEQ